MRREEISASSRNERPGALPDAKAPALPSGLAPSEIRALLAFAETLGKGGMGDLISRAVRGIACLPAVPMYALTCEGDFWHLTYERRTTHVKDGVGPKYLAVLLANPGMEVFCPDIITAAHGNPAMRISQSNDYAADKEAIRQYKNLCELKEDLAGARKLNDLGRQDKLQDEVDLVAEHLQKLYGLRGRTRKLSSDAERARTSVTNAIRRMLTSDAVMKKLPAAHRHLDNSISRGIFMSYNPEKPIDWAISTGESQVLHAL